MRLVKTLTGGRTLLALACISVFGSALAQADNINIYNSGVGAGGTLLPGGADDPHYTLVVSPDPYFGTGPASVVLNVPNFPMPAQWLPENASSLSQWIAPRGVASSGNYKGTYDYQTTFDLSGLDPSTADLAGQWATDNGATIWLNGVDTGVTLDASTKEFTMFTPFSITSGFIGGINTLDFVVINAIPDFKGPNPTGIRIEISGSASAVPEPGTWVLLVSGISLIGMARRRKERRPSQTA